MPKHSISCSLGPYFNNFKPRSALLATGLIYEPYPLCLFKVLRWHWDKLSRKSAESPRKIHGSLFMNPLFIGIELPPSTKQQLARLCSGLSSITWIAEENLLITLRYLGPVTEPVLFHIR